MRNESPLRKFLPSGGNTSIAEKSGYRAFNSWGDTAAPLAVGHASLLNEKDLSIWDKGSFGTDDRGCVEIAPM